MSKLINRKKGLSMTKTNKEVYKDVLRFLGFFLFVVLILCTGSLVCADGGKGSDNLAKRYVSDGLLLYNELANESGRNFLKARKIHANLLGMYLDEMEDRQRNYAAALLTSEALDILTNLKSIRKSLAKPIPEDIQDPNDWAKKNIEQAGRKVGELLSNFEPYLDLENPFVLDGFEELGDKCRRDLYAALEDVKVKLRAYIKDLTIKNAEELCLANRKAIVHLFIARFARFDDPGERAETSSKGLDIRAVRQFRGDINRTIYWNRVCKRTKEGSKHAYELTAYSVSELRRLRILQSVLDSDMREAQALLLIAFRDSFPLKDTLERN